MIIPGKYICRTEYTVTEQWLSWCHLLHIHSNATEHSSTVWCAVKWYCNHSHQLLFTIWHGINTLEDLNIFVSFKYTWTTIKQQLTLDNQEAHKLARQITVLRHIVNFYQSFWNLQLQYQDLKPGHNCFLLHTFPTHSLHILPFYNIKSHLLSAPVNKHTDSSASQKFSKVNAIYCL